MVIVIGLGNPGSRYVHTRHNAGVLALDAVVEALPTARWSEWKENSARRASIRTGESAGVEYQLVKPSVYMNESGVTARAVAKTPRDVEQMIVLHDEIDLPVGAFRVVFDRGAGGHNGVTSIIQSVGTQAFARIRIGVSPVDAAGKMAKPPKDDVADFVLASFTPLEKLALNKCLQKVADAVVLIAEQGIEAAMNKYN